MTQEPRLISKSRYLSGLQCAKLLWAQTHARARFPPIDAATQFIFDQGHEVGRIAQRLAPGGVEVQGRSYAGTVARTQALLPLRRPIYEASFAAAGIYCRVDILEPAAGAAWNLLEVKSSTRVKDLNLHDIAVQAVCLQNAGIEFDRLFLVHIDTTYVREGEIDPERLLHREDVTDTVRALVPGVLPALREMHDVLESPEPAVPIGAHCTEPYACALMAQCWAHVPDDSVTHLTRAGRKAWAWIDAGHTRIADLADDELNDKQRVQRDAFATGAMQVDRPALGAWLDRLAYPLVHLDFEAFAVAVPRLDGTRPYQRIAFQASVHIVTRPAADPEHHGFLATEPRDPRPALARFLAELPREGSVLAWHASYERGVLRELALECPEYAAALEDLARRMIDLETPFAAFLVHHPDQRGSTSIKAVLPALVGDSYAGEAIGDGNAAAGAYVRAVYGWPGAGQMDVFARDEVMERLRRYCKKDTESMVRVLAVLEELVGDL